MNVQTIGGAQTSPKNSLPARVRLRLFPRHKIDRGQFAAIARDWRKRLADYSHSASQDSDPWLESHLPLLAGTGAVFGIAVGIWFALP
jgi:hypothetical protein